MTNKNTICLQLIFFEYKKNVICRILQIGIKKTCTKKVQVVFCSGARTRT